jgi:Spy/CpxP family protein refolding chaperone
MWLKPLNLLILGSLATAALSAAHAQETNLSAATNFPAFRPQPPAGFGRAMENPAFNVLTEMQRTSIAQIMQTQQEKVREIDSKLRDARRELFESGLNEKFDESVVRKQALVVAGLEAEQTVLRLKALSQVQPPLSPGQIEKLRNILQSNGGAQNLRPMEQRSNNRRRILQSTNRDENDLPAKQ